MYLDRCVLCCENDWDDYFELHEITTKDTYILKVSFHRFVAAHNIILKRHKKHTSCSEFGLVKVYAYTIIYMRIRFCSV